MAIDRIEYEPVWVGESVEIPFGLVGVTSLDGYVCKMQLLDSSGNIMSAVNRDVTDKNDENDRFVGMLSGAETAVKQGLYTVVAKISNADTGLVKYVVQGLNLKQALFVDGA